MLGCDREDGESICRLMFVIKRNDFELLAGDRGILAEIPDGNKRESFLGNKILAEILFVNRRQQIDSHHGQTKEEEEEKKEEVKEMSAFRDQLVSLRHVEAGRNVRG